MAFPSCPQCGSKKLFKNGFRSTISGANVQRWLCRECGYRFSEKAQSKPNLPFQSVSTIETKTSNRSSAFTLSRQVCASDRKTKNLHTATETKTVAGISSLDQQTLKGKLLEFEFYMQKQGYSEATVKHRVVRLAMLSRRGANLQDTESVKTTIALQKTWCDGTKANVVDTYTCFLQKEGLTWNPPRYKRQETIPFIPSEAELNMLIGAGGKKLSTFLQGLKETGADPGELAAIESKDVNKEARAITLNHPVKGHRPRILTVSADLIRRFEAITGSSNRIFNQELLRNNFNYKRKTTAHKLENPRLLDITFIQSE